jgi:hypothetical protein
VMVMDLKLKQNNTTMENLENKQTAVEWLISQIPLGIRMNLAENGIDFQQALAMEKEHLKKAFNEGSFANDEKVTSEEYYNEQYYKVVQKVKELNNNHDFNL